jgi:bifunctional DNA-binding transcriptional regulator/antitoxin component of YhaV-PrlF toxin-antitoxin module
MVQFKLKMDRNRKVYIPKAMREAGFTDTLELIPNAAAAVVYPSGTSLKQVQKSVQVILQDIQNRIKMAQEEGEKEEVKKHGRERTERT